MGYIQVLNAGLTVERTETIFDGKGNVLGKRTEVNGVGGTRVDTADVSILRRMRFGKLGKTQSLPANAIVFVESEIDGSKVSLLARSESERLRERLQFMGYDGTGVVVEGYNFAAIADIRGGTSALIVPGDALGNGVAVINNSAEELIIDLRQ